MHFNGLGVEHLKSQKMLTTDKLTVIISRLGFRWIRKTFEGPLNFARRLNLFLKNQESIISNNNFDLMVLRLNGIRFSRELIIRKRRTTFSRTLKYLFRASKNTIPTQLCMVIIREFLDFDIYGCVNCTNNNRTLDLCLSHCTYNCKYLTQTTCFDCNKYNYLCQCDGKSSIICGLRNNMRHTRL